MAYHPDNEPSFLRYRLHQEQYHGRNRLLLEGDPQEVAALDALYESLEMEGTSNNWRNEDADDNTSIITSSICDYTGIECQNGHVTVLDLTSFGLTGSIPTEIEDLSKLERLSLGNNELRGSLPTTLQSLTKLQHLEVFRNNLMGPILGDWTLMGKLKRLLIQSNHITGTLDSSLCTLKDLKGLDLFDNPLSGSLPSCLGNANTNNKLSNLRLQGTLLTGSIPDFLCDKPIVNGLSPNMFGCNAIACPIGTFLKPLGRQTQAEDPCQPCLTATSIGSTTCPLALPTFEPSTIPSAVPTTREPTFPPTILRTEAPSMAPSRISTDHPTSMPTMILDDAKATSTPSSIPAQEDQGSKPSLGPSMRPTSAVATNPPTNSDEEFPSTSRLPFDAVTTGVPSTLNPTITPQESTPDVTTNRNGVLMAESPHDSANWTLLTVACILSFIAMATVVLARRMGRKWWYAKHRSVVAPDFSTSDDDVSMESDSGWDDTESSVSSYHWAGTDDGGSAHEEESLEPWSVSLPETASSTTSDSVSRGRY
jgi:hypothetical protein